MPLRGEIAMKNDKELGADITAELLWDPAVDATGIAVSVKDGVATIGGQVRTFAQNDAVARAVHRIAGVRGLVMRLEVKLDPDHKRSDEELTEAALYALRWNSLVPDHKVKVEVEDGWLTLTGEVDFEYQRASAEQCIGPLVGIFALDNKITLKEHVDAGDIGLGISAALARHARREAEHISVEVDGGEVTLRGKVGSLPDHDAAVGTALATKGVWRVVDELVITG
jgi:osmotically-inducible protein OsmY